MVHNSIWCGLNRFRLLELVCRNQPTCVHIDHFISADIQKVVISTVFIPKGQPGLLKFFTFLSDIETIKVKTKNYENQT